ncbi:MAG TPA: hypothetical protein VK670_06175 [Silvibacterium sp.]|nr:hypothetical protein [Silvibacterium sp.]
MKSGHIAEYDRGNADQMQTEQEPTEAKLILAGFQSSVTESQEYGEGGNPCRREGSEQRSKMRNTGESDAVQREDGGQEIKPPEKITGQGKKPP